MSEKLLPCPFCGSAAEISTMTFGDSVAEYYRVACYEGHYLDQWEEAEEEAVAEWNTRHLPPEVEKVIEAARGIEGLKEFEMRTDNEDLISVFVYLQKLSAAIRNLDTEGRK